MSDAAPTRVRYLVVGAAMLMAVLLYLDRFCVSFALPYIRDDLHLTGAQAGWYLSAFFFAYALAQVPSGWLSDRFGARAMLTLYILVWSLFTALMGLAAGFLMLIAMRVGIGLGQAGAYPTSAGMVSKWVPFAGRGAASSLIAWGGRVGGFTAPLLTAYLMVAFVPADASALLEADDLNDAPGLCRELQAGAAKTTPGDHGGIARRVLAALKRHAPSVFAEMAAVAAPEPASGVPASDVPTRPAVSPDFPARLADGLSRAVIADRDFARADDFDQLKKVEREALRLLARPREGLTGAEAQRLNRFLLEAVYPRHVRKFYTAGWRPVMFVYGGAGLLVALVFYLAVRDRPARHPGCNAAELELIEHGRPTPSPHGKAGRAPLVPLLRSVSMWLVCLTQFASNIGWLFLVSWLPTYLYEVHEVPILTRGWMAALPLAFGWPGMLLGGRLTDAMAARLGLRWGRGLPIALTRFLAMAAYLSLLLEPSAWGATAAFAVVAFASDMGNPASWAFKQDVGGRYVGSVLGWANMWGNLGASVSPPLLQLVIEEYGYQAMFLTCAASFLVAGLAALGIDASKPIAPPDEPE